jgi:hypothetical protein
VMTAAELFQRYMAWKEAVEELDTHERLLHPESSSADRQKYEELLNKRLDTFAAFDRPYHLATKLVRSELQGLIAKDYRRKWRTSA